MVTEKSPWGSLLRQKPCCTLCSQLPARDGSHLPSRLLCLAVPSPRRAGWGLLLSVHRHCACGSLVTSSTSSFRSPRAALPSAFMSGANKQLLMSPWPCVLDVITTRIFAIGTAGMQTPEASRLTAARGHFQLEDDSEEGKNVWHRSLSLSLPTQGLGLPGRARPCHSFAGQQCVQPGAAGSTLPRL